MTDRKHSFSNCPILGVPIARLPLDACVEQIITLIERYQHSKKPQYVATANVDFLINTHPLKEKSPENSELLQTLREAHLVTADGMPLVWLSRLLGEPIPERVTGVDLLPRLTCKAEEKGLRVYFLGGEDLPVTVAITLLKEESPALNVVGIDTGSVNITNTNTQTVARINKADPDLLFVSLGNPKQELWFQRNKNNLKVPVIVGIGGSLNFISGSIKRAPTWVQRLGLEWLHRLLTEPKRLWKRYTKGLLLLPLLTLPSLFAHVIGILFTKQTTPGEQASVTTAKEEGAPQKISLYLLPTGKELSSHRISIPSRGMLFLDAKNLKIFPSKWVGELLELFRKASIKNTDVYLCNVSDATKKMLRAFKIDDLFQIISCHEREEILANTGILLSIDLSAIQNINWVISFLTKFNAKEPVLITGATTEQLAILEQKKIKPVTEIYSIS